MLRINPGGDRCTVAGLDLQAVLKPLGVWKYPGCRRISTVPPGCGIRPNGSMSGSGRNMVIKGQTAQYGGKSVC